MQQTQGNPAVPHMGKWNGKSIESNTVVLSGNSDPSITRITTREEYNSDYAERNN
jgi:hypothetical protein